MATFRLNDPETWLPGFARGNSIAATKLRVHHHDGSRVEHAIAPGPDPQITTTDARAIRHLQADPRFAQIS